MEYKSTDKYGKGGGIPTFETLDKGDFSQASISSMPAAKGFDEEYSGK